MGTKSQKQLQRSADQRILGVCKTFNEIMTGPNPLTAAEVRALVNKRPEVYGILENWAKMLAEIEEENLTGRWVTVPDVSAGIGVVVSVDPAGRDSRALVWYPNPSCCQNPRLVETSVKSIKLVPRKGRK